MLGQGQKSDSETPGQEPGARTGYRSDEVRQTEKGKPEALFRREDPTWWTLFEGTPRFLEGQAPAKAESVLWPPRRLGWGGLGGARQGPWSLRPPFKRRRCFLDTC